MDSSNLSYVHLPLGIHKSSDFWYVCKVWRIQERSMGKHSWLVLQLPAFDRVWRLHCISKYQSTFQPSLSDEVHEWQVIWHDNTYCVVSHGNHSLVSTGGLRFLTEKKPWISMFSSQQKKFAKLCFPFFFFVRFWFPFPAVLFMHFLSFSDFHQVVSSTCSYSMHHPT